MLLKQSTARNRVVLMVDSADHVTGKTGLTLTIKASKDGATFATITPTVTELEAGFYNLALTTTHTNTLGDFALHITSTGADPSDLVDQIVSDLFGTAQTGDAYARLGAPAGASVSADVAAVKVDTAAVKVKTDFLPSAVAGAAGGVFIAGTNAATSVTTALTANITGNLSGSVGSVTGNVGGNVVGSVASVVATVSANLTQILGTALTETAGQIAAGFKKFFNIATPAATMDHLVLVDTVTTATTATNLTNAPTAGDLTATMKASVTTAATAATPTAAAVTAAVSLSAGDSPVMQSGTAAAGGASTITIAVALGADAQPVGSTIKITSGTGAKQARVITGYVNSTKVVTVDRAWVTNPDSTSVYSILYGEAAKLDSSLQVTAASVQGNVTGSVASVSGAVGSVTGNVGGSVASVTADVGITQTGADKVWGTTTRLLTAGTNIVLAKGTGVTGFNDLSAAAVNAEADTALSDVGLTTTITGRIDAAISSRLATSGYTTPPTVGAIADQVWDEALSGHAAGGSAGAALSAAGSGSSAADIADAVWDELVADHAGVGSMGAALAAAGGSGDPWATALPGAYGAGTAGKIVGDNLDAAVSTRATATALATVAGYVDTEVAAIKAKTDNLPSDPADASDIAASFSTVNSTLATIAGYVDTEVAAIKAKTDLIPSDPADASDIAASFSTVNSSLSTIAGYIDTEVGSIATDVAAVKAYADRTVVRGTVSGTSPTTTTFTSSALSPAGVAADQFKGRIIVFDNATTTTALRGQATDITASSAASNPLFTFTALTTAPQSGDTFSIL